MVVVCIHIVSTFTYSVRIIANLAHMCALKTDKMIRAERVAKENSLSQSREAVLQHGRSCSPDRENSFIFPREAHLSATQKLPRSLLGIAKIDESVYERAASPKDSVQSPMLCRNRMRRKEKERERALELSEVPRPRQIVVGCASPDLWVAQVDTLRLRNLTPLGCATPTPSATTHTGTSLNPSPDRTL